MSNSLMGLMESTHQTANGLSPEHTQEIEAMKQVIHFHSGDDRFCGSTEQPRRFTLDPNEVTCRACMARDTFVLSPQGESYVASLEKRT